MPTLLGIDLGTSRLTALAVDTATGEVLAQSTRPNEAETTAPEYKARGFSEWSAPHIGEIALGCLRDLQEKLGERGHECAGLGIAGQQHGSVIVDANLQPLRPFIGWQDRRADAAIPGNTQSFTTRAIHLAGVQAPYRTGCRLASGYLAVTLYWLREMGELPANGRACFISDYVGALLTGTAPVTDPTDAAASGALNLTTGDWDAEILKALALPRELLPEVRPSGHRLGGLTAAAAEQTGLPAGLPVFSGIGDNQASYLGSVCERTGTAFVNVGTGGQVSSAMEKFRYDPRLETRPLPGGGFLLVCAGLSGGRAYAALEHFFRDVARDVFSMHADSLYPVMNRLAESAPRGAGGLKCDPFFSGTRQRPDLRGSFSGISVDNFEPAHLTRALLEGMSRAFRDGFDAIRPFLSAPCQRLIGAGNGLRENALLTRIIAEDFALPMSVPAHREEAAFGAALLAGVGAGVFADWNAAGKMVRYA